MYLTKSSNCEDPKDKIYGLLGLQHNIGLNADYALSVVECFKHFGIWSLGAYPNLVTLSYASGLSEIKSEIPTWAPGPAMLHLPWPLCWGDHFCASGAPVKSQETKLYKVVIEAELHLEGRIVDHVSRVVPLPFFPNYYDIDILELDDLQSIYTKTLLECFNLIKDKDGVVAEEAYTRFCRAMLCETTQFGKRIQDQYVTWFRGYLERKKGQFKYAVTLQDRKDDNLIDITLQLWSPNRRFCITDNG
jgi:hypothetical protein